MTLNPYAPKFRDLGLKVSRTGTQSNARFQPRAWRSTNRPGRRIDFCERPARGFGVGV